MADHHRQPYSQPLTPGYGGNGSATGGSLPPGPQFYPSAAPSMFAGPQSMASPTPETPFAGVAVERAYGTQAYESYDGRGTAYFQHSQQAMHAEGPADSAGRPSLVCRRCGNRGICEHCRRRWMPAESRLPAQVAIADGLPATQASPGAQQSPVSQQMHVPSNEDGVDVEGIEDSYCTLS